MNTAIKNRLLTLFLAVGVLTVSQVPSAFAAGPYLGGPSIIGRHEQAVFNGGNYAPNSVVRMVVAYPDNSQHSQVLLVGNDGTLKYEVPLAAAGNYTLTVQDEKGKVLKSVIFAVTQ